MFLEESQWIFNQINKLGFPKQVLDVGSSDLEYREIKQPYIKELYKSVEENTGKKIETLDLQAGTGVDYVRDVTLEGKLNDLKKYDLVLFSNIIEHIEIDKIGNVLDNINLVLKDRAFCIITIPFNIGYHPSPIDNGFRPTVEELAEVMDTHFAPIICEQITCSHYREPYISNPSLLPFPVVTCGVFKKKI